jgi:two-component system sensor histidine kinase YesM
VDNGPGIDPDTLQKIRNWDIKPNGFGIGLRNIHERITLVFGEQYGLEIHSEAGIGTKIQMRIPYNAEE